MTVALLAGLAALALVAVAEWRLLLWRRGRLIRIDARDLAEAAANVKAWRAVSERPAYELHHHVWWPAYASGIGSFQVCECGETQRD